MPLDVIPEGWVVTPAKHWGDCETIEWPKKGVVSLDYDARKFRHGISFYGPADSDKKYQGRGWRDAMRADAVARLRSIYAA